MPEEYDQHQAEASHLIHEADRWPFVFLSLSLSLCLTLSLRVPMSLPLKPAASYTRQIDVFAFFSFLSSPYLSLSSSLCLPLSAQLSLSMPFPSLYFPFFCWPIMSFSCSWTIFSVLVWSLLFTIHVFAILIAFDDIFVIEAIKAISFQNKCSFCVS